MRSFGRFLLATFVAMASQAVWAEEIDFNRDVRPILSAHCFKCHGPDDATREAGLRFDQKESALAEAESGARAIVPGNPEESELITRIHAEDESLLMPPATANKPLTETQKQVLRDWIEGGAKYDVHWAFVPPRKMTLPAVVAKDWPRNPIDQFILARLEAAGLKPSAEADKYTLIRRLSLDLIGLPPTPEEIDAFVQDPASDAYERLVERLLASPHFGERWARRWLDLARYADTNGYEKDRVRSIWPYRDWVINAFNQGMPYDQFSIEQLAGDMLPNATQAQLIATGLHRNTMLNEEGGIDPLEFRYYAVVDRVNTTGTIWMGLTLGCAQCHTHKYDPITHRDYYQVMAYLNNADEPIVDVESEDITKKREALAARIATLEADLASHFSPAGEIRWHDVQIAEVTSAAGATMERMEDGSIRVTGVAPQEDSYFLSFDVKVPNVSVIQLEAMADPELPAQGPGRTPHGNFVLTEVAVARQPTDATEPAPLTIQRATADFAQEGFPPEHTFDGDQHTGWAIHGKEHWNVTRTAQFYLQETPTESPARWTVRLDQKYGGGHTLGRFRLRLGEKIKDDRPEMARRQANLEQKFNEWLTKETDQAAEWVLLKPLTAASDIPSLTIQEDHTILASGDQSKRDVYRITLENKLPKVTALRLEVLPDETLPKNGPGRIAYEGPFGDFFLSEVSLAAGMKVAFKEAFQSFANDKNTAAAAIDGDPQTGWSINGGQGKAHTAIFRLDSPLVNSATLNLELLFERYYAAGLGKFRIWATSDERPDPPSLVPTQVENDLRTSPSERSQEQNDRLLAYYLSIAPELAAQRAIIEKIKQQMPEYPTTLVMSERPPEHPRQTRIHKRGEFLQPTDPVEAKLPSLFAAGVENGPSNRLELARWLVSKDNPLAARVAVNRYWAALFGVGLVRTAEDFGYQGSPPTHPELLDWLAVDFQEQGWRPKELLKRIVMSATYRQSSAVTPEHLEKDPANQLLARAPRVRLDAELVRDLVLRASGLLSPKIGGPSVFPPQPPGVTAEGTYGPLEWKVSSGEDRYRRGLYTFTKRTAPYAMLSTFDAPSGEACIARRDVSNTPLQALTLLNDTVVIEAAQELGKQLSQRQPTIDQGIHELFIRCVGRPPTQREQELLGHFHADNRERLARKELVATTIAGSKEGDPDSAAAWTLTARAVLNLDETVTKE